MIEFLSAINFSMWQVVVIFVVIYFRKDIQGIINTLVSVKIGSSEISFNPKKEVVEELKNLKELASKSPSQEGLTNYVSKIDHLIQKKYVGSLINIKNNTSLLWDKFIEYGGSNSISSKIRFSTLQNIESDLLLLADGGFFKYNVQKRHAYSPNYDQGVVEVELSEIRQGLYELIDIAKQY